MRHGVGDQSAKFIRSLRGQAIAPVAGFYPPWQRAEIGKNFDFGTRGR
jgi:hypothetical protein